MRLFALLVLPAVVLVFNSGCFIPVLQLRADTVLTVRQGESKLADAVSMGFSEVTSKSQGDCFTIQADGFSPREHETWIYWYRFPMVVEHAPGYGRHIRIVCCDMEKQSEPRDCRIQMLLERGWTPERLGNNCNVDRRQKCNPYQGQATLRFKYDGDKVSIELTNLKLAGAIGPNNNIYVSGKVVVTRSDNCSESFAIITNHFNELWAKAVSEKRLSGRRSFSQ